MKNEPATHRHATHLFLIALGLLSILGLNAIALVLLLQRNVVMSVPPKSAPVTPVAAPAP